MKRKLPEITAAASFSLRPAPAKKKIEQHDSLNPQLLLALDELDERVTRLEEGKQGSEEESATSAADAALVRHFLAKEMNLLLADFFENNPTGKLALSNWYKGPLMAQLPSEIMKGNDNVTPENPA